MSSRKRLTRRELFKRGALGAAAYAATTKALSAAENITSHSSSLHDPSNLGTVGEVNGGSIDPVAFLEHFDYGDVTTLPSGQTLRSFEVHAVDREIEVAPGVFYPAWTYNGQVPGPTLRATEGDLVRVHFQNGGSHPHTIHFHGIHPANMDGVFEVVLPGEEYRPSFVSLPYDSHSEAHREGAVRRVHHRSQSLATACSGDGDGHERVRHKL
jgi:FtsP/CotA-like multicopper oxidase with cupredoxin domain